ncbi:MAG TPA: HAMP domain-containing sensor histidine kinase, partial [Candidatus Tumulicola sp.]|nr:HAMP domain-containing sensor histidine kinase [Candidatus Tumulicola sp.]
ELLGAISHELRSPLGRARIALEIARDRVGDGAGLAPLDEVEKQLSAVDTILGDLLDVTRAGLADLRLQTRPFVPWLRERVADEPTPPPVSVRMDAPAESPPLAFDAALLARVVHNLLVNARAHGHPADVPIEVRVEAVDSQRAPTGGAERGSWIRVLVRDRGAGFPPGFADRAFEPFVRGDASRSRPKEGAGYGLGLTIVRRIVEAHGGRVFARNAADAAGAEVGFELPCPPAERGAPDA